VVDTLVGVLVGGLLVILGQVAVGSLRARSARRSAHRDAVNAARLRQWLFFSAQQAIRDAIEGGKWWPDERSSLWLPTEQELRQLAGLLPDGVWTLYTAAARRLSVCAHLRRRAGEDPAPVDRTGIQQLIGAFVTVDTARRALEPVTRTRSGDLQLDSSSLTRTDIEQGLTYAEDIDVARWRRVLVPGRGDEAGS
jgi:hypothetical protein